MKNALSRGAISESVVLIEFAHFLIPKNGVVDRVTGCVVTCTLTMRFRILFRESSAFDMPQTVVLIDGSAIPRFSGERCTEKTSGVMHDVGIRMEVSD